MSDSVYQNRIARCHRPPGALVETLSAHLTLSKSPQQTLAGLIFLLVNVRMVILTQIASQFSATAKADSSYCHLQRFFQGRC